MERLKLAVYLPEDHCETLPVLFSSFSGELMLSDFFQVDVIYFRLGNITKCEFVLDTKKQRIVIKAIIYIRY